MNWCIRVGALCVEGRVYRMLRNWRGGMAKDEITLLRREHEMVNKARTWTRVGGALLFV